MGLGRGSRQTDRDRETKADVGLGRGFCKAHLSNTFSIKAIDLNLSPTVPCLMTKHSNTHEPVVAVLIQAAVLRSSCH